MKNLKLLAIGAVVATFSGCASVNTQKANQITVGASVKESIEILDRRGILNEALCVKTSISLECELLGINANDPNHQFIRFDLHNINNLTKINITRWIETNSSDKRKTLDLSRPQLDSIAGYIEKHRNRVVNK